MGSGRDKRKKVKGKTPGAGAEKTAKKTVLNEQKAQRRALKNEGDDDLDVLLAQFKLQDKQHTLVKVDEDVPTPSPRCFASFTSVLIQKEERILLFGGEFYDNAQDKMATYNDLYIYVPARDSWSRIYIPKGPGPRSGHQAVFHKGFLYLFGGELTSSNMEKFRHFKELWRLDLSSQSWEEMPSRGGPCARSGHRMTTWKNRMIMFGGFEDTGKRVRYFNDTWIYDLEERKWEQVGSPETSAPAPRGGCQIAVFGDVLFVFGGHSVLIDTKGEEIDKVHDDIWALNLNDFNWQKVKKEGMAPGPRMSFGLVVHKRRAIVFGGVTDAAGRGDRVYSELHNELYQFNLETRRWFPLGLRCGQLPQAKAQGHEVSRAAGGALRQDLPPVNDLDKDSVLYKAAVKIQSRYRGYIIRKAYKTYKIGGKVSELLYSPAAYGIDLSSQHVLKPRARANPMLTVCGNLLFLMGGIVEVESKDVTLDDLWKLDLVKLDGWTCVRENSVGQELLEDDEWGTDDDNEEEEVDSTTPDLA